MNLKDAIGKDHFIFDERQFTDENFQKMTSDELATFKARLNLKITNIADIIEEKKRTETKEWYKRRKYALSLHAKMVPYINSLLKLRNKLERSLSDCFMDQARILISAEHYELILGSAEREYKLGREGL